MLFSYSPLHFFFTASPTPEIYTLSLHDALPISLGALSADHLAAISDAGIRALAASDTVAVLLPATMVFLGRRAQAPARRDRKSTRLNSSHVAISYAVFCLKKKKKKKEQLSTIRL